MKTSIVFLSAKSKDLGIGHFSRICKIVEVCSNSFLVDSTLWLLSGNETNSNLFDRIVSDEKIENLLDKECPEFIIFDLHSSLIDLDFKLNLQRFRQRGVKIIGIDCSVELASLIDILWIPSFFLKIDEKSIVPMNVIYGWDSYLNQINQIPRSWSPGDRVLILTGGSDVAGQGRILPGQIEDIIDVPVHIDWVQGPYSQPPLIPTKTKHDWTIHYAPKGLNELISRVNYAITLYGVSLFELMSGGVPTVVYSPYAGRDEVELAEISKENVCIVAKNASDAVEKLANIMMDKIRAKELSDNCAAKLSKSGLDKFKEIIISMKKSK